MFCRLAPKLFIYICSGDNTSSTVQSSPNLCTLKDTGEMRAPCFFFYCIVQDFLPQKQFYCILSNYKSPSNQSSIKGRSLIKDKQFLQADSIPPPPPHHQKKNISFLGLLHKWLCFVLCLFCCCCCF